MAERTNRNRRRCGGFTLVEVVVASAIVGLLFVGLMESLQVGLQMLDQSERTTVATSLAENIHEIMLTLPLADPQQPQQWGLAAGEVPPFNDVADFDGYTFSPPIDANWTALASLANYTQQVTVSTVSATNFNQVVADGSSNVYRVTVTVTCRGDPVSTLSWLCVGSP